MAKDKIPGGLAAGKKPSDFPKDKLEAGTKIEMEHTTDRSIAQEIAMDHLTEDMNYYEKLKTIEKQDRIEITADGKQQFDVGAEPLDKLKSKWNKLKKALDNSKSILDMTSQEYQDDESSDEDKGDNEQPEDIKEGNSENKEQESEQQDENDPNRDISNSDDAIGSDQSLDNNEDASEEGAEDKDVSEQSKGNMSDDELAQHMKDDGYSDEEIAYIMQGHQMPTPTLDDHKMSNEKAKGELIQQNMKDDSVLDRDHKKRMNELQYKKAESELADPEVEKSHRKRMLDLEHEIETVKKKQIELELEHKKKLLDLEFDKAKQEASKEDPAEKVKEEQLKFELEMKRLDKELEMEFKKKELALKLKMQEELGRQKLEHQKMQAEEDAKTNAAVKKEQAKHKIVEAKNPKPKDNINE